MSCDCNSSYNGDTYGHACRQDIPYPNISHESVPSLIDNLVNALYGTSPAITKTVVNGRIVWNIPCDPVTSPAEISWLPREEGEGLLCYAIRAFNSTFPPEVTLNGVQTLTNKTLTAPVINNPTGIVASNIGAGTFVAGVTLPSTQIAGVIPNANTTATALNSASTIVLRDSSGNFAAGTISATQFTGNVVGNVTGSVTGNVIGNLTGTVTGNASSATNLSAGATGSIPYQTAAGATGYLAAGATGRLLTQNAGSPAWTIDHIGTNTNDSAAAGYVGEYILSQNTAGTSLTQNVVTNITSITLSAGDWDVSGNVNLTYTTTNSTTFTLQGGITTTSATLGALDTYSQFVVHAGNAATQTQIFASPEVRLSLSTSTIVYLIGFANGGLSSITGRGTIRARRVR